MPVLEATFAALELMRDPPLVHAARRAPLPRGIDLLIKIAAGEADAIAAAETATQRSAETLRRAAEFYIEQILFAPDADSYRCLGVAPSAPDTEIRHHMALLARWLHPDVASVRAPNDQTHASTRITLAWEDVKNRARRSSYDSTRKRSRRTVPSTTSASASAPRAPLATKPSRKIWQLRSLLPEKTRGSETVKRSGDAAATGGPKAFKRSALPVTDPKHDGSRRFRRLRLYRLGSSGFLAQLLALWRSPR